MSGNRRRTRLAILTACLAALAAVRAGAEVIGSPHDLFNQQYLLVSEEKLRTNPQCQACHFTPPDDRPLLAPRIPPALGSYGQVAILCASCHDGVSMVDRNVDAGLTVFHPKSHRLPIKKRLPDTISARSGLPGIQSGILYCTSCHDPHTETYRPFLRLPVVGICQRCHLKRVQEGFGVENATGDHPVGVDPYDNKGGASPISVKPAFAITFPLEYPREKGIDSKGTHWRSGGHLTYGNKGKVECITCHAFHGSEGRGPAVDLLALDPGRVLSDEVCEGCHRGKRGDGEKEPPYPNPGGTETGRTYHPVDDDRANGLGWIFPLSDIARTSQLRAYRWGTVDQDYKVPRLLCTTCHVAHRGMAYSPCLAPISQSVREDGGVKTFCEICHREAPEGHHGYTKGKGISVGGGWKAPIKTIGLGHTYGTVEPGKLYCSTCHRGHNAGYGRKELDYIPILVDRGTGFCEGCHIMGVSHFLGDPSLPSTYNIADPPLKRTPWPATGKTSFFEGEGEKPKGVTCTSCHTLSKPSSSSGTPLPNLLLAPAGEDAEWNPGNPEEYLCTGCHGEAPATIRAGATHPLLEVDSRRFPLVDSVDLLPGESPVTYTEGGMINCHSCHRAHDAALPGGVYILKVCRGENTDPKAIRPPRTDYVPLCHSCHPKDRY